MPRKLDLREPDNVTDMLEFLRSGEITVCVDPLLQPWEVIYERTAMTLGHLAFAALRGYLSSRGVDLSERERMYRDRISARN